MARQLLVVNGVATTLIAFIAGLTLNFERLERRVAGAGVATIVTLFVAISGLAAVAWLLWPWLPIAPTAQGATKLAIIGLLVVVVVSFSPTMSAAVITETGSRGRLSDFVLAMVVLADIVVLVLFSLLMQFARAVFAEGAPDDVNMLARLAWEILGAAAVGSLIGAVFALYLRYIGKEVTLALLLVALLLSQVGAAQRVEPLLAAMAAGIVIANLAVPQGEDAEGRDPVAARCRFSSCFSWRWARRFGWIRSPIAGVTAIGLAATRIALIWIGVRAGLRAARASDPSGRVHLDGADLAGRHHARPGVDAGGRVSDLGRRRCRCCSSR